MPAAKSKTSRRRPVLPILLVGYLLLLGASHLVRRLPREPELGERQSVELAAVDAEGRRLARPIEVTWLEWGRENRDRAPALILIHGSPGSASNFDGVAPLLAEDHYVVAPDLPGFGPLHERPPSLSIRAHAEYVDQLLAVLEIERAHLLGFSLGGAVTIHLADPEQPPENTRVASLTLLSATGVQETELFGSYGVNHAVHGLQLLGLTLVDNLVPHFGAFDRAMLGVAYARNFFDSDQRPIRAILGRVEVPALVVHGEQDRLVPVEAAREHHRLLPQSELELTEYGHLMVFMHAEHVASLVAEFVTEVEGGKAPTRNRASTTRRDLAGRPWVPTRQPAEGLALLALVGLIAAGTWLSEDLATITAGLLVANQRIGFGWGSLAAILGIVSGDLAIYACGRWLGIRALARGPLKKLLSAARVERARRLFETQGPWVIFASRFTPGTRVATYFAAGLVRSGALRFGLYLLLAAALWVPAVVWLTSRLGEAIFGLVERFRGGGWLLALVGLLLVWWLVRNLPLVFSHSGRDLLRARWARRSRWEFLPTWILYLPVMPTIVWQALRRRRLSFTAVNPGIVDGGVVGESKSDILARLPPDVVPDFEILHPDQDRARARHRAHEFFTRLGPPAVLKPDVGERGRDVVVARTPQEIDDYLRRPLSTILCQRYVGGEEFGVLWIDEPGRQVGRVWSVAAKHLPEVSGDGARSLRQLILDHPRVRYHADRYLEERGDLDRIPQASEIVRLGDLGTHCRGATFTDARHLATPELTAEITRVSRAAGFGFGRYDVRVPSAEHLARGEDISVLEFNGVASEAAHIYDPEAPFASAIRTLRSQWRLAYELGARCAEKGDEVMGFARFCAHLWHQFGRR